MKKLIVGVLGITLLLTACNTKDNHHETNKEHQNNTTQKPKNMIIMQNISCIYINF